jgi:serine/threonine protein kinase
MGEEKTNSNDHHQLDMYYRLDTNHKAKFAIKYIEEQLAKKQELCELKSSRRKALNQYFSDNPHTAEKQKKEIEKRFTVNSMRSLRFLRRKMTIEEFRSICVIGRGANSEVRLVRRKDSKEVFAMKILEKQEMIARGQIYQVLNELKVMKLANSAVEKLIFPKGIHELSQLTQFGSSKDAVEDKVKSQLHFPILHYAFQDLKNLYFVMEFLPGGDLVSVLMKYDVLNEDQCRFYIAETALAINYLHSLGFVHRDM